MNVDSTAPDGYMPDGTPVYIKVNPGCVASPLQLAIYAALNNDTHKGEISDALDE